MESFCVTNGGVPDPTAVPSFVHYVDKGGAARTQPTIANLGGGLFGFQPTQQDKTVGTAYLLDCGGSADQRYLQGLFYEEPAPFACIALLDAGTGGLWAGAAPTFAVYVDKAGNALNPPTLRQVATYFFLFNPAAGDVFLGASYRVDPASGAEPVVWAGGFGPPLLLASSESGVKPEQRAADALRDWLLKQLPAKVAEVNTYRAAVLKTPTAGPFTVPNGAQLRFSNSARDVSTDASNFITVNLTAGVRTATQLAVDFNASLPAPAIATVDDDGRLVLADQLPPVSGGRNSYFTVAPDTLGTNGTSTGANVALGFAEGGEVVVRAPLEAPTPSGVLDGEPSMGFPPEYAGKMVLVIGDRNGKPVPPENRRDTHLVELELQVLAFRLAGENYRSREHIESALRCVREALTTTRGRYLGREAYGDIKEVSLLPGARIAGVAFRFAEPKGSPLFDAAQLRLTVRVFERPAVS
jgi:hypothetical protein